MIIKNHKLISIQNLIQIRTKNSFLEPYAFLRYDSPLWHACLGAARPHQCWVNIFTVMPAAHRHVDGLAAGVHAADGWVSEGRGAADGGPPGPGARRVHRTGTRCLFAAPYAGTSTPIQGTAATAAWDSWGGVQGPAGGLGVTEGGVRVGDDHWIFHALGGGDWGLLGSFASKKSDEGKELEKMF